MKRMGLGTLMLACLTAFAFAGSTQNQKKTTLNVAIVVYEGMEILDFAGPAEVFAVAGHYSDMGEFRTYTVGKTTDPLLAQGFIKVTPEFSIADCPKPDIVVFPGGNSGNVTRDEAMMKWLASEAPDLKIAFSVCTGAFVLAKAGLLDGKKATTWYGAIDNLKKAAPKASVLERMRFIDNGKIVTTAGVSAGIDGALHVVARLLGDATAQKTAEYMEYDKWEPKNGMVVSAEGAK